MPSIPARVSNIRDPQVQALFSEDDPEKVFEDLREIGHGSFGAVYYARNQKTSEVVAIKKMSYNGKQSQEKWQDIIKEVRFLSQLRHTNCIEYKGCYLREHTAWLAMEYCIGSASDIIEVHKQPLEELEISAISHDALQGLAYLHANNRIHRDVKAGNILLTDNGTVKLADFGSASFACPANSFVGTPYWMAPEVILAMDEGQYDGKVDIWSLGITCIELAERKPPLFNMNGMSALYHIAQNEPPTLTSDNWTGYFRSFIEGCLRKDPLERPSAEHLLSHQFVTRERPTNTINNLIERTKDAVRLLDGEDRMPKKFPKFLFDHEDDVEEGSNLDDNYPLGGSLRRRDGKADSLNSEQSSNVSGSGSVNSLPGPTPDVVQPSSSVVPRANSNTSLSSLEDREPSRLHQSNNHFATIRPKTIVSAQAMEHQRENELREQMSGYKRMRRQHQKQLQQLENRVGSEMEEHKQRLDKEFEQFMQVNSKDLEKLLQKHQTEMDRKVKSTATEEKKLYKSMLQQNEFELKNFQAQQKREYKQNKEQMKRELDSSKLREHKENLQHQQQEAEQNLVKKHREHVELEIRKYKRCQLLNRHSSEQDQVREELTRKQTMKDQEHIMLLRHHELTQDLEYKHLKSIQDMRIDQMRKQQMTELVNQKEYMKRAERELAKKHALETKQLPKCLKQKEASIKKQYNDTCKIQQKQYKALREQEMRRTPKEQQKSVSARLKEEKERKMLILGEQYNQTIANMLQSQSLKLDESQESDMTKLKETLDEEMELLNAFQTKTKFQIEMQHERERRDLQERVSLRRALLEQKMEEEKMRLQNEKSDMIRRLHERQAKEIENFDDESIRMGFSAMIIAEMQRQTSDTDGGFSDVATAL
ncbi:serine/threonine-protein kinase TAO1-like [Glandiceps talaboti]